MGNLSRFRAEVDNFMAYHPRSPLSPEQQDRFEGLAYYGENPALSLTVEVERYPDTEPLVEMETSTEERRRFRRWGRFDFEVDGEGATLVIYSDPDGGDFFLPFKDATNGAETYGAGRYLDNHRPGLARLEDGRFEVDFNYAYNPYCAYSEAYSCPLPPRENWLDVAVKAGEKKLEG